MKIHGEKADTSPVPLSKELTFGQAIGQSKDANDIPLFHCYKIQSPQCPNVPLWAFGCVSCPCNCCGACIWYNWFLCACKDGDGQNEKYFSCVDLKGIYYAVVPVRATDDNGRTTDSLAFFSSSSGPTPDLKVGCFCVPFF